VSLTDGADAPVLHREWLARGEGAPIVFVHGFGGDLNGWRPLSAQMKTDHGRLALDLPGHGRSGLTGEISLEAFSSAVEETLSAEGVGPLHLVAHSFGATVAAAFVARAPERVRSLTLLSPGGLGPEMNWAFQQGFLAAQDEADLSYWLAHLVHDPAKLGSAVARSTIRLRQTLPLVENQSRLSAALFANGEQTASIRPALAAYPGPRRIVFGLEDRIVPARRHVEGLPGAVALHLFANVGHMPHFEARAEVARLIADSVAAGEQRAG
jgi:pimeloyl-ACP methyl ester carboxylesterase